MKTTKSKDILGLEDYYKHTGNSKFGRRGIHKRIRLEVKKFIHNEQKNNG